MIAWLGLAAQCRRTVCRMAPTSGTIKKFFEDKGFGFVTPDDGSEDIFVHVKDNPDLVGCQAGDAVTVNTEWDDRKGKYKGTDLSVGGGGGGFEGAPGGGRWPRRERAWPVSDAVSLTQTPSAPPHVGTSQVWRSAWSPTYLQLYFYDPVSRRVSWTLPSGATLDPRDAAFSSQVWRCAWSPQRQRHYFYDPILRSAAWTVPSGFAVDTSGLAARRAAQPYQEAASSEDGQAQPAGISIPPMPRRAASYAAARLWQSDTDAIAAASSWQSGTGARDTWTFIPPTPRRAPPGAAAASRESASGAMDAAWYGPAAPGNPDVWYGRGRNRRAEFIRLRDEAAQALRAGLAERRAAVAREAQRHAQGTPAADETGGSFSSADSCALHGVPSGPHAASEDGGAVSLTVPDPTTPEMGGDLAPVGTWLPWPPWSEVAAALDLHHVLPLFLRSLRSGSCHTPFLRIWIRIKTFRVGARGP